jgi:hypothetical protein
MAAIEPRPIKKIVGQTIPERLYSGIEQILHGIDKQETDDINGWWETSTGAEYGKRKLAEIKKLIETELSFL